MAMFPEDLQARLSARGITTCDEAALRTALEAHCETYTLIKLSNWPARRWKCRYRLLMGEHIYDAQSAAEAYARGLLAALDV